jgi:hypothetical protein
LFPSTIASAVSVVVVLSSAEALFLFLNHFSSHSSQQLLCTFSLFLSTIASAVSVVIVSSAEAVGAASDAFVSATAACVSFDSACKVHVSAFFLCSRYHN